MRPPTLAALLAFLLLPILHVQAAVLAIDYGAEFTKLSLVKPGVPFDVVLDKDSKRKIQSVVGWKRDDRVFGQEAKLAATRFPDTHFPYVKPLLGSTNPSPLPIHPNPPSLTDDGVLIFPHPSPPTHISPSPKSHEEVWTPTALLAHQISYFRHLAESLSGEVGGIPEVITQVVVTVPSWWDQYQRRAYRDALELQGLTCLAMIGEGTGVALNYAMTRTFPDYDLSTGTGEKEYHIIYDSGALSTTATVIAFYQTSVLPTPKSKTPINTTHIEVLGTGWSHVGGVLLDVALQEILTADFIGKTGRENIVGDKRALAKLAREATRVKQILSANQEANVAIESLFEDVDYRSRMSRAALETALEDSTPLFSTPITAALSSANLALSDITSVILFGGNTRVPLVQSAIKSVLGEAEDRIAQNVNTDEAAVLGAAYYGAALSRQFKMKNFNVTEKSVYDVVIGDQVFFPQGTKHGEKKTLTFPASSGDSTVEFAQATHTQTDASLTPEDSLAQSRPILSVSVIDVESALSNFTAPSPVVNLTMRLDSRGILSAANAVLVSDVAETKGGVAGAIKGLFGGKKEKGIEEDVEEIVEDTKGQKVALRFREKHLGIRSLSAEEKRATKNRLLSIAAYESARFAREEARNLLEGYLYRLSGLLSDDAENKALHEYATKEERGKLQKGLDETFEWLGDHADDADEKTLRAKRAALETMESPIIFRYTESHKRTKSIDDFTQAMFAARSFLTEAKANNTVALELAEKAKAENGKPVAPPKYTEEELNNVEETMTQNQVWFDGLMTTQITLESDKTKDPVITSKEMDERGKKLQATVLRLINKKQPKAPRPSSTSTSSSSSSTTSSTDETESTSATASPSVPTDHGPEFTATPPSGHPHEEL